MDAALTVQDARELQATDLKLIHHKLQSLPADLGQLTHLTRIDASDNPIQDITTCSLPQNLKELTLTGCQLTVVPQCLTTLSNLQHLQLSANKVHHTDALFQIPYLLHAGLAYNHISSLGICSKQHSVSVEAQSKGPSHMSHIQHSNGPSFMTPVPAAACRSVDSNSRCNSTPPGSMEISPFCKTCKAAGNNNPHSSDISTAGGKVTPAPGTQKHPSKQCKSPVMSLDLSHNDITDLPAVLQQLQQLSQLKSLSLKGNPISLLPCYKDAVLQQLPHLMYLDGQKLDGIVTTSNSRPTSSAASRHRPGSSRRPGSRPNSSRSADNSKDTNHNQQQQFLTGAFADLLAPQDQVTVPLLLHLTRLQIVESAAKVFAGLLELSMKKQADVIHQQQQQQGGVEGAAVAASSSAGDGGGAAGKAAGPAAAADATADTAVTAASGVDVPVAPLQPLTYHIQTIGPNGSEMCSTPLIIQPPAVAPDPAALAAAEAAAATAAASAATAKKGKGSKAAKPPDKPAAAAAAKGKAGAKAVKGRPSADEGTAAAGAGSAESQLADGCLKVNLQLPVSVAGRDWLRQGFTVKLIRTHQQPETLDSQQLTAAAQIATANSSAVSKTGRPDLGSGKGGSKPVTGAAGALQGCSTADASSQCWQYSTQQQLLGTAKISAANLLEGGSLPEHLVSEGSVEFFPEPPLYDAATGTLMLLKEAKANLQPVGSCRYKLVLHNNIETSGD